MARLAISVAGAAIGGAIGGPTGARLGFTAGSILGSVLFPEELPDQVREGPRLGDLSVSASTYGQAIPLPYGTVRLAGNCIWATPIEERRNVDSTTSGGKGGGTTQTSTTVSYSYYGTFALAFAEGVADDVIRIWADGKLIYDKSGTGAIVRKAGLEFRFYDGSETQLPDSLIEADKGSGNVPAHRGLIYIVFDSLPLADFGNRRPQITAEIAMAATPSYPLTAFTADATYSTFDFINGASVLERNYDFKRKTLFINAKDGSNNHALIKYQCPAMSISALLTTATMWTEYGDSGKAANANDFVDPKAIDPVTGDLISTMNDGGSASGILRHDANSLKIKDEFGLDVGGSSFSTTSFQNAGVIEAISVKGATAETSYLLCASTSATGGQYGVLKTEGMEYVAGSGLSLDTSGTLFPADIVQGAQNFGSTDAYVIAWHEDKFQIYKIVIDGTAAYESGTGVSQGVTKTQITDFAATDFDAATTETISSINSADTFGPFAYDPDTTAIIGLIELTTSGGDEHFIVSIDASAGTINWITNLSSYGLIGNTERGSLGDLSKTQYIYLVHQDNTGQVINKFDGTISETLDQDNWFSAGTHGDKAIVDYDFFGAVKIDNLAANGGFMYFDRASANSTTLDAIVSDLCDRAGLDTSTEIDVTDLTDTTVLGYMVGRPSTVRAAIEPLSTAYFFDAVESDYKIKFVDRGGDSAATITQDDLGAESNNEYWVQTRGLEQELPMRLSVGYMDYDMDYQQGTQQAKRAASPFPVMYSKNEVNVALPIVLDDDECKKIAEKLLFNAWTDRDRYSTFLSWEYLKLDPADVITVNLDNGDSYKVRIGSIDMGANMALNISTLAEEPANYSSTAAAENNFTASSIKGATANTYLKIHNVPLLADTHDQARIRSVLYAQAGPFIAGSTWTGATLYSSTNQIDWTPINRLTSELTYGSVQGTFAAPADVFAVDTTNTLTIWPTTGGDNLSSITYSQLLAGESNLAIVGSEVINFQNVTDNGDGSYTLDTFLRGRRGTDTIADSHSSGEYFYLVNDTNTEGFTIPLGNIDSAMYFKAVGDGQTLEEAQTVTVTPTGEDLKPYAPVNATRTDDSPGTSDITIGWDRRTRINGSGVGTLPLNEDSESYSVDILDGSGGSVVRTLTSSTESVEYDAAQIASDFGTAPNPLYVKIYQVSAQVGRGKAYEHALYM